MSLLTNARSAVERIDAQTRVDYLVAYYPSNAAGERAFRTIRVEVTRPGVSVSWRHGYYAGGSGEAGTLRSVMADRRLLAAMSSTRPLHDIQISVTPSFVQDGRRKGGTALVRLAIDAAKLGWRTDELSRHVVHLDVGVLCGDAREAVVGQARVALDVALSDAQFQQAASAGVSYEVRAAVSTRPRFCKIAVYSNEANLSGNAVAWLPPQ